MSIYKWAKFYAENHIAPIPIKLEYQKNGKVNKKPLTEWASLTVNSVEDCEKKGLWHSGIGLRTGVASKNLFVLDYDLKHDTNTNEGLNKFLTEIRKQGVMNEFSRAVKQKTVSGGFHYMWRVERGVSIGGNATYARLSSDKGAFLECRAEGGFVAFYPTSGYSLEKPALINSIPVFTSETHQKIITAALLSNYRPLEESRRHQRTDKKSFSWRDLQDVEAICQEVEKHSVDLSTSYENWWTIAAALEEALGEDGRSYFHRLSKFHPDYDHHACDKQFDAALKDKGKEAVITLGSLINLADTNVPTWRDKLHQSTSYADASSLITEEMVERMPPLIREMMSGATTNRARTLRFFALMSGLGQVFRFRVGFSRVSSEGKHQNVTLFLNSLFWAVGGQASGKGEMLRIKPYFQKVKEEIENDFYEDEESKIAPVFYMPANGSEAGLRDLSLANRGWGFILESEANQMFGNASQDWGSLDMMLKSFHNENYEVSRVGMNVSIPEIRWSGSVSCTPGTFKRFLGNEETLLSGIFTRWIFLHLITGDDDREPRQQTAGYQMAGMNGHFDNREECSNQLFAMYKRAHDRLDEGGILPCPDDGYPAKVNEVFNRMIAEVTEYGKFLNHPGITDALTAYLYRCEINFHRFMTLFSLVRCNGDVERYEFTNEDLELLVDIFEQVVFTHAILSMREAYTELPASTELKQAAKWDSIEAQRIDDDMILAHYMRTEFGVSLRNLGTMFNVSKDKVSRQTKKISALIAKGAIPPTRATDLKAKANSIYLQNSININLGNYIHTEK